MTTQTKTPVPAESVPAIPVQPIEQPIPKWVGVMVALVIVGSMLGGGGLWAWSYYNRPDPKNLAEVQATRTVPVQQSKTIVPGIVQASPALYQVSTPDFYMMASKVGNDFNIRLTYKKSDLLTPEQSAARLARLRLASDPLYAKALNVTDEQVAKLKALPAITATNPPLVVAPAELDKLKKMWTSFIATNPPKPADGQALISAVQNTGKAALETTRASLLPDVKKIQEILTPEQIAPFKPATP
jgi:hypothetical protein